MSEGIQMRELAELEAKEPMMIGDTIDTGGTRWMVMRAGNGCHLYRRLPIDTPDRPVMRDELEGWIRVVEDAVKRGDWRLEPTLDGMRAALARYQDQAPATAATEAEALQMEVICH